MTGSRPAAESAMISELVATGVSDVWSASAGRAGLLRPLRPVWAGARAGGRAVTVQCAPGDALGIYEALDRSGPGDVLVVATHGDDFAYWGGLITVAAQTRGLSAVVVDGLVRDVADMAAAAFPVWARGVSPIGPPRRQSGRVNTCVEVAGVQVDTGDLVVADDDGVAVLPAYLLGEVHAVAADRRRLQEQRSHQLRAGRIGPLDLVPVAHDPQIPDDKTGSHHR